MNKIVFYFNYPKNEYFGGIANIISNYSSNSSMFAEHDFDIDYLNPDISFSKNKFYSLMQKIWFLRKAKNKVKKLFASSESIKVFHIHSSRGWILYNDLKLAKYVKKHFHSQVVLSIHFASLDSILLKCPFRKSEIKLLNLIDHIIVLSEKTKNEIIEQGILQSKISVLYTFHSFKEHLDSSNVLAHSPVNLLFMGSIDQRKGILDLVSALSLIKDDVVLNICGGFTDTHIQGQMERAINNDQRISFKGYIKGEEKEKLFSNSDIFILPSYGEGMPIVIMEALYYGCAIVSTNVGAIPEIIHEENGFLIEPGDVASLASEIHSLVVNPTLLTNIKKNNKSLGEKYSLKENVASLCDVYRSILDVK